MGLPGVKVGPLDPDATESFGQVSGKHSARQLIRLHTQLNPPHLKRALARPRDDARSKAVLENLDEVTEYVSGLTHDNGDPMLPKGARVNGASVRGEFGNQVLTFTFELPSGRVGKWFAPFNRDVLPESFDAGAEYHRVQEMKDRGVVALDSEGTRAEILDRHNRELRRERDALRAQLEGNATVAEGGEAPANDASTDARRPETLADLNETLGRENAELKDRLAKLESIFNAAGGGYTIEGVHELITAQGGGQGAQGSGGTDQPTIAAQEPPFAEYDGMNAADLANWLKADERTAEERHAVLEYEKTHANRKTVTSTAENTLGLGSNSTGE